MADRSVVAVRRFLPGVAEVIFDDGDYSIVSQDFLDAHGNTLVGLSETAFEAALFRWNSGKEAA